MRIKTTLKTLLILIVPILFFAACGEDEPNNPSESDTPGQNGGESSVSVDALVKNNVTSSSSYADYTFTFTISSMLKDKLPDDNIQYGVGHETTSFVEVVSVSVGNQAYSYSTSTSGKTETITIKNPFWFYYVFGEKDQEKWVMCSMYYSSYIELKQKGYGKLDPDEKELYDECVKYLNECQKEVKKYYRPTTYVQVNNKFYKLKSYQIP